MDEELIICRCQEVTQGEILEAIKDGATTVDGVKRRTRACMGLCQGYQIQDLRPPGPESGSPSDRSKSR